MNTPDLVTIIGNISRSLYPVQHLITGFAYLLGILFFITAISKFRKMADRRAQSSSQEKMFSPLMYLLFGAIFIYLPSALLVLSNTTFGTGNVLNYTKLEPTSIYSSIGLMIRTAGILWFIRGSVLLVQASHPGTQEGPKGLVFLIAGVLAMNFDNTVSTINKLLEYITQVTLAVKSSQGY